MRYADGIDPKQGVVSDVFLQPGNIIMSKRNAEVMTHCWPAMWITDKPIGPDDGATQEDSRQV